MCSDGVVDGGGGAQITQYVGDSSKRKPAFKFM
jgi:hypothetical protein